MNLTQLRHAIFASTGGLILTSAVAVFWSLGSLDTAPQAVGQSPRANGKDSDSLVEEPVTVSKDQFAQRLQKSLYDAQKPKPTSTPPTRPAVKPTAPVRPPKPPRLDWLLVGTIIESGKSVAIISDASGKTDIRAAGEEVELEPTGVLVRKIDSEKVTLEVRGKESTLRLKKDFASSSGGAGGSKTRRRNNR